jgi:hypothetical protein
MASGKNLDEKVGFDYFVTDAFKVGADPIYVSSQYCRIEDDVLSIVFSLDEWRRPVTQPFDEASRDRSGRRQALLGCLGYRSTSAAARWLLWNGAGNLMQIL